MGSSDNHSAGIRVRKKAGGDGKSSYPPRPAAPDTGVRNWTAGGRGGRGGGWRAPRTGATGANDTPLGTPTRTSPLPSPLAAAPTLPALVLPKKVVVVETPKPAAPTPDKKDKKEKKAEKEKEKKEKEKKNAAATAESAPAPDAESSTAAAEGDAKARRKQLRQEATELKKSQKHADKTASVDGVEPSSPGTQRKRDDGEAMDVDAPSIPDAERADKKRKKEKMDKKAKAVEETAAGAGDAIEVDAAAPEKKRRSTPD
ncbi:hypothetical protein C8R46DRAFT_1328868 [Mycena filopes]|nr:hypothetical protein C8R46DRAFT_1328868 [Mycena filopes]